MGPYGGYRHHRLAGVFDKTISNNRGWYTARDFIYLPHSSIMSASHCTLYNLLVDALDCNVVE